MEDSPAGLVDLSHQLFLTPCMLLKITFPHSLCLASVITIMSQPVEGPCPELRSKERHTQAGLKTPAHPATALGQVSPWETAMHYPPELRSPSFVQAWLLVRCPYYHTLGHRDMAEMLGSQEAKEFQLSTWSRSQKVPCTHSRANDMPESPPSPRIGPR